jgi:hypothetical protein
MFKNNPNNLLPTKKNFCNISRQNEKISKIKFAVSDSILDCGADMHFGKQHKKNLNVLVLYLNAH